MNYITVLSSAVSENTFVFYSMYCEGWNYPMYMKKDMKSERKYLMQKFFLKFNKKK